MDIQQPFPRPLLRLLPLHLRTTPFIIYAVGFHQTKQDGERRAWMIYSPSDPVVSFAGYLSPETQFMTHRSDFWAIFQAIHIGFNYTQGGPLIIYTPSRHCAYLLNELINMWRAYGMPHAATWDEEGRDIDPNIDLMASITQETTRGDVQIHHVESLPADCLQNGQAAIHLTTDEMSVEEVPAAEQPATQETGDTQTEPEGLSVEETFDDDEYGGEAFAFDVAELVSNIPDPETNPAENASMDAITDGTSNDQANDQGPSATEPISHGEVHSGAPDNGLLEDGASVNGAFWVSQMFGAAADPSQVNPGEVDLDSLFNETAVLLGAAYMARDAQPEVGSSSLDDDDDKAPLEM